MIFYSFISLISVYILLDFLFSNKAESIKTTKQTTSFKRYLKKFQLHLKHVYCLPSKEVLNLLHMFIRVPGKEVLLFRGDERCSDCCCKLEVGCCK